MTEIDLGKPGAVDEPKSAEALASRKSKKKTWSGQETFAAAAESAEEVLTIEKAWVTRYARACVGFTCIKRISKMGPPKAH